MRDTILSSYLNGFMEDFGYKAQTESDQFELFSAYCTVCHAFTDNFEVEKSIVGKGGDTGIDAIAILINGRICHDYAELEDVMSSGTDFNAQFVFVQSKTSPKFDSGDVLTFGNGVRDFFKEKPTLVINDDIKSFRKMKELIYQNARRFDKKPVCHMFYVTTSGAQEIDENLTSAKGTIVNDINDEILFSDVFFNFIGGDRLYKMYKNIVGSTENEIEIEHYIVIPEAEEGQEAILGRLSCKELIKLISDESGVIDKKIFTDNIRDFMGRTGVNAEIENTIKDINNNKYFMLFNNGITAVAKKVHREKNKLRIENIQIVNGCQTSNILYENKDHITDKMHISIKIVATQNQDIINTIIRSTNRQNMVPPEAFESLEEFHRKFEDFCKATNRIVTDNIYYERRSRQYVSNERVKPLEIVTLSGLLYANMSMFFSEPHSVHRYYGELLKANKHRIFMESHKLEPYFFAAYCLHKITKLLRKNPKSKKHSIAKFHALTYMWKVLSAGKMYRLNSTDISNDIMHKYIPFIDNDKNFLNLAAKSVAAFYNAVKDVKVESENVARSKAVTEKMISSITDADYIQI